MNKQIVQVPFLEPLQIHDCFTLSKENAGTTIEGSGMILYSLTTRDRMSGELNRNLHSYFHKFLISLSAETAHFEQRNKDTAEKKGQKKQIEDDSNKVELLTLNFTTGVGNHEFVKKSIETFKSIYQSYYQGGIPKDNIPFRIISKTGEFFAPYSFIDTLIDDYECGISIDILTIIDAYYNYLLKPQMQKLEELKKKSKIIIYS